MDTSEFTISRNEHNNLDRFLTVYDWWNDLDRFLAGEDNLYDWWLEREREHQARIKQNGRSLIVEKAPDANSGYVYVVSISTGHFKIGRTHSVEKRMGSLAKVPFEIKLVHSFHCDNMIEAERFLHAKYNDQRVKGEWFLLSKGDLVYIKSIKEWNGSMAIGDPGYDNVVPEKIFGARRQAYDCPKCGSSRTHPTGYLSQQQCKRCKYYFKGPSE